jgi:glycosyltransferase involved in cell wall biosynthesis
LLKFAGGGAVTIMVGLQPRRLSAVSALLARAMWTDLLLVTSEAERRQAVRSGANAVTIHTGVDFARFQPPLPGQKPLLRAKWGLPIEERIVLHVGHLKTGRNLEALYQLTALPATTVVLLASSRREKSSARVLDSLVRHGVRVIEGYRQDIADLYRLADCYVFPVESSNSAISLPLSVIEALACGVPVVTSRFGALPEFFSDAPGVRFVDGTDELVDGVEATLRDPPTTTLLDSEWSWDEVASRLLDLRDQLS